MFTTSHTLGLMKSILRYFNHFFELISCNKIRVKSSRSLGNEISTFREKRYIIRKNDEGMDYGEICEDEEIEYGMKEIQNRYIYF